MLTNKEINILKQALPIIQKLVNPSPELTDIQKLHQLLDDLIKEKNYLDSFLKDIKDLSILKIVVIRTSHIREHLSNWQSAWNKT